MIKHRKINDFIKVTHHYDEKTLVSKDLELLQIIKIENKKGSMPNNVSDIKNILRSTISEYSSEDVMFYVHNKTFQVLNEKKEHSAEFSQFVKKLWIEEHQLKKIVLNEIYISIVHKTKSLFKSSIQKIFNSLFTKSLFNKYLIRLEETFDRINKITEQILENLKPLGAQILEVSSNTKGLKSELMSFYLELVNFTKQEFYLEQIDLSNNNNLAKFYFGNNVISSVLENREFFSTVISVKNIVSINDQMLESILSLKINLVITEIIIPVSIKEKAKLEMQLNYLNLSSSPNRIKKFIKLESLEQYNDKIFQEQVTFTIYANTMQDLQSDAEKLENILSSLGIIYVLEDINLEKQFWSSLPCNASFITRTNILLKNEIANFAQVRIPNINADFQSPWGDHIAIFRSLKGFFYHFHLHDQNNNNNVLILGSKKSGKTTLINFLLSQAVQLSPFVYYFNLDKDSNVCLKFLGGEFKDANQQLINPFLLENNESSRMFLKEFFQILLFNPKAKITKEQILKIENLVQYVLNLAPENRILLNIINDLKLDSHYGVLVKKLEYIEHNPIYKNLFGGDNSNLKIEKSFQIINLSLIQDTKVSEECSLNSLRAIRAAIIYSYFHFLLINNPEKKEKIIVVDKIGEIIYLPYYSYIIDKIKQSPISLIVSVGSGKNSLINVHDSERENISSILSDLEQDFGTKIFLFLENRSFIQKYFQHNVNNLRYISQMEAGVHKILLVQNGQEIILNFNIATNDSLSNIFSSTHREQEILEKTLDHVTDKDNLDELFLLFYKNLLAQEGN